MARGITLWRTSIQTRILTSVVLLSAAVIAIVGFALASLVAQRLVDSKVSAADEEIDRARVVVEQAIENSAANELQALLNVGREALVDRAAGANSSGALTSYEPLLVAPVSRGTTMASLRRTQPFPNVSTTSSARDRLPTRCRKSQATTVLRTRR